MALPRQQTLRALIDWSYGLLDAQGKVLLARLSIFTGGWTLEAAEMVGSNSAESAEELRQWALPVEEGIAQTEIEEWEDICYRGINESHCTTGTRIYPHS